MAVAESVVNKMKKALAVLLCSIISFVVIVTVSISSVYYTTVYITEKLWEQPELFNYVFMSICVVGVYLILIALFVNLLDFFCKRIL